MTSSPATGSGRGGSGATSGPVVPRILVFVDEFTRECVGSHVARAIGARQVIAFLGKLFDAHAAPAIIRSDNRPEFIADTVVQFLADHGVTAAFIEKGSPQQNCYVERFNGTMRRELLDAEIFHSVTEARVLIHAFVQRYKHDRPHRSPGMNSPHGSPPSGMLSTTRHSPEGAGERHYPHTKWTKITKLRDRAHQPSGLSTPLDRTAGAGQDQCHLGCPHPAPWRHSLAGAVDQYLVDGVREADVER